MLAQPVVQDLRQWQKGELFETNFNNLECAITSAEITTILSMSVARDLTDLRLCLCLCLRLRLLLLQTLAVH